MTSIELSICVHKMEHFRYIILVQGSFVYLPDYKKEKKVEKKN